MAGSGHGSILLAMSMTTVRTITALAALGVGGLLGACGDDEPASDTSAGADRAASGSDGQDNASHRGASASSADARHVEVEARSFAFEPEEISVGAGEDLAIVLASEDGVHDLTVDELDMWIVAEPGEEGFGMLPADEPGRYTFYCAVEGHREAGMEGVLVVEG
jgi:plastocyanin